MQMKRYLAFSVSQLLVCAAFVSCVHVDGPYNEPLQQKVRLECRSPEEYALQVGDMPKIPVPADGRVVVDIPSLLRGHKLYLLRVLKVSGSSPEDVAIIAVQKEGRTVRKLSLRDLKELPIDREGYKVLRVD
jgi:hypothetical protein